MDPTDFEVMTHFVFLSVKVKCDVLLNKQDILYDLRKLGRTLYSLILVILQHILR